MNQAIPAQYRILLVDDEPNILRTFRYCLEDAGYAVATARNLEEAERRIESDVFDVCLLDLNIGEASGLDFIPVLVERAPWIRTVIVTAHGSIDSAVEATRAGVADYLTKPCSPAALRMAVQQQCEARRLAMTITQLEQGVGGPALGQSSANPEMMRVLDTLRRAAQTDATILIRGESGTGKGVLARAIHGWSERSSRPFAVVNCPSLSSELLESEMFGHKKGAFTGASESTMGRVSQAEHGTLFLDEIGDFPLQLQPKLLRFVQEREYEPVGNPITRKADVRLVAATNRNLEEMVVRGQFREDLFFRINVISVTLPPLRERPEDITTLANAFLAKYVASYHRPARAFSDEARAALIEHSWPGNVRELQNLIERAVILSQSEFIEADALGLRPRSGPAIVAGVGSAVSLEELERQHIAAMIEKSDNLEAAAKTLGIDPSTLWRKRKFYGL